jgi:peptidoglycan/LPS O-acetylase OafA/YrhL
MSSRPTIAYQPALDGVRALAVTAVLLFHGGVPGFDGGYLGVSVFFTLSGYLITSLLVHEHHVTGRIDLATFYSRRLRRLLPASALCLLGVVILAAVTDVFDGVVSLRSHVLGSLFQVANWVFLAGEGSYQDLLARTNGTSSPLEHFWSLAIEEQFYWVWPPLMALVLGSAALGRRRVVIIGTLTALSLIAAPVIAQTWGPDAAYWATPARIGEILVGAFIAVALYGRAVGAAWGVLAPVSLVVLAITVVLFPASGGPAYEGALPLIALVSGGLLIGLQVEGPVRAWLALGPLVWLGRISYGVYLFHWPVYVLLDAERTGLDGPVLFAVRLAVTMAVSVASYQALELRVRHAPRLRPTTTFIGSVVTTIAVFVAAIALVPTGLGDYWETDEAIVAAAAIEVDDQALAPLVPVTSEAPAAVPDSTVASTGQPPMSTAPTESTEVSAVDPPVDLPAVPATLPPLPALSRPVRIIVAGDSTANATGAGILAWAAANPDIAQAELVTAPGCGFLTGGEWLIGEEISAPEGCDDWVGRFLLPAVERSQPDVVMAMVTSWDLIDRRWDTEALLNPLDADYAARLDRDYRTMVDDLLGVGAAHVALVRHPIPDSWWLPFEEDYEDPVRHAAIYALYESLAAEDPDRVRVVALDRYFTEADLDRDEVVRPDGIHVTPEAATQITTDFLGDRLVRVALGAPHE